jgi:hypothetical protein
METQYTQYPFRCPHAGCNRGFKRQNGLTNHLRHGGHTPDSTDPSDSSEESSVAPSLAQGDLADLTDLNPGVADLNPRADIVYVFAS